MNRSTAAGERDRWIEFFASGVTETASGSMAEGPGQKIASAWAKVNYGTGAERRSAGSEQAQVAATARLPANASTRLINSSCVCRLDDATWDVTSAVPWGRRELDITIVRRV